MQRACWESLPLFTKYRSLPLRLSSLAPPRLPPSLLSLPLPLSCLQKAPGFESDDDDTMSTASLSSTCAILEGMEDRERSDGRGRGQEGEDARRREREEILETLIAQV